MHARGHDAHMAIAQGVAEVLAACGLRAWQRDLQQQEHITKMSVYSI